MSKHLSGHTPQRGVLVAAAATASMLLVVDTRATTPDGGINIAVELPGVTGVGKWVAAACVNLFGSGFSL